MYCICSNQAEAAIAVLEAGADVNGVLGEKGRTLLMYATVQRNVSIIRAIATTTGVMLDAQVKGLYTGSDFQCIKMCNAK